MKKLLPAFLVLAISILMSCSGSKKAVKTASREDLKGKWQLVSTAVEGVINTTDLRITSFDDAALNCFEGSEWNLPNNGYGSYTISKQGCSNGARQILWSYRYIDNHPYFNFKNMDGVKKSDSKKVQEGYSLEVTDFGKGFFTAKSPVSFEGKTIYITYNFKKI